MEREKVKIPPDGEKVNLKCAVCGKDIIGHTWSYQKLCANWDASFTDIVANACGNCGFAYCDKGHKKQLKAMGIKSLRTGACPVCGTMLRGDNLRFITVNPDEFEYKEGLCMTCGADEPLHKVTIWSGIEVEGDQLSPDITWMGLVVLIPGKKEKKVAKVQSKTLDVCEKCLHSIKPELFIEEERAKEEFDTYLTQRKPFEKIDNKDK